jgi:putative inorganic carbon (HCO3(-)) transporter
MALFLTLLSIAFCYFSPADVVPTLAPYHLQQFILGPAMLTSVTVFIMRRSGLQSPQCFLMVGFWFAVVMSLLVRFWLRASFTAFIDFGLVVCIYFLVSLNAFSLKRITIFCRVIVFCALFMAVQAIVAYHTGYLADKLTYQQTVEGVVVFQRVCGYGILHDPNDFAQFLLVALAFLGLSWKKHNLLVNQITVFLPASILIYAIYLTFSRGAIFGLVAIAFIVTSRHVGKIQSVLIASVLFLILVGAQFSGGRDISIHDASAAGRVVAWGSGIADFKSDPLFGVGFGQFTEYNELTAHNSFVLCFAELGMFGYFFWLALLVSTVLGLEALAHAPAKTVEEVDFSRYVTTIRAALYTFLATSWFLSQTYKDTLYILLALAGVLIYIRKKAVPGASLPMMRWVPLTCCTLVASILLIYATIRVKGL